jgi:hypothetical protein
LDKRKLFQGIISVLFVEAPLIDSKQMSMYDQLIAKQPKKTQIGGFAWVENDIPYNPISYVDQLYFVGSI